MLIGVLLWGWHNEQSTGRVLLAIFHFLTQNPLAAGLYIALYALRTFIFFPAMVLTIGAGSLFGFWMGALVALVGENLSASLAYAIARFFGSRSQTDRQAVSKLTPFRRALHKHAFPAVLTLRATYLPFDPVNYGCGLLRVRWWPYFT
ncbi:MAG: VTT domain-containing protein, partial [Salinisphaera sp.]|nr:VTT domain-containing protein [Salinisphaera sp.]